MAIASPVALTTQMVCEATAGRLAAGDTTGEYAGVSTDTRAIAAGSLFVALRGDRFDGHDFAVQAVSAGATGVLTARELPDLAGAAVVIVDDTLTALQALARAIRRASGATVIAITGSAGKTTTKEITADLLSLRYRVFRNKGNLNNHIGLPLSLVELRHGPDLAVVELGMNHAGEIRALIDIAEPEVRVWTNVGDAHIGHFGTREAVARAKAEVLEQAGAGTLVVANADDELVMAHVREFNGRRLTFGESPLADIRATQVVDRGFDGTSALVATPAGEVSLTVPLPGRVHLSNVLAAVAVAVEFEVPLPAIADAVAALQPVARRGSSLVSADGVRVIDDSYNASPAAVRAALASLAATATTGRRIAILGEMLELGESSATLHEACGRAVAESHLDMLIAVGGAPADDLASGAIRAGLPSDRVRRFPDSAAASDGVAGLVSSGDVVLIKGSRGARMDRVADRLREVA